MQRDVKIRLGSLSLEGLAGKSLGSVPQVRAQATHAIRYYLTDRDAQRGEWPYPQFLRDRTHGDLEAVEVELRIEGGLWQELEEEARRQGVTPELLAQHAILYFLADREAGRAPQRIRAA